MLPPPSPPADSLHKWVAIAGTAIFIAFGTNVDEQYTRIERLLDDVEIATAGIEAVSAACKELDSERAAPVLTNTNVGPTIPTSFVQTIQDSTRTARPQGALRRLDPGGDGSCGIGLRKQIAENRTHAANARSRAGGMRLRAGFAAGIAIFGLLLSSAGFMLWRRDETVRQRSEDIARRAAELEMSATQAEIDEQSGTDSAFTRSLVRGAILGSLARADDISEEMLMRQLEGTVSRRRLEIEINRLNAEGVLEVHEDLGRRSLRWMKLANHIRSINGGDGADYRLIAGS